MKGTPLMVFGQVAYIRVIKQKYKHLGLKRRHNIKALLDADHAQSKIAEIIGVHKSTISRKPLRNAPTSGRYANKYRPEVVQRKTINRHRDKRKHIRFTEDLKDQATHWLKTEKLSPERISGRWSMQGLVEVSHEAIYQWIWRGKAQKNPPPKNSTNT